MDFKPVDIVGRQVLENALCEYEKIRIILPIKKAKNVDKLIKSYRKLMSRKVNGKLNMLYSFSFYWFIVRHQYCVYKYPVIEHVMFFYMENYKDIDVRAEKTGDELGRFIVTKRRG